MAHEFELVDEALLLEIFLGALDHAGRDVKAVHLLDALGGEALADRTGTTADLKESLASDAFLFELGEGRIIAILLHEHVFCTPAVVGVRRLVVLLDVLVSSFLLRVACTLIHIFDVRVDLSD